MENLKLDTFNLKDRVRVENPFATFQKAVNHDLSMRRTALVPHQKAGKRVIENVKSGDKIVDVGMNTGMVAFYIAGQVPDITICAVEENDMLFEVATNNLNLLLWGNMQYDIKFEQCELDSLPIDDKSADMVYSHNSMHFWNNPVKVLQECVRICKDDGAIIIEDFNRHAEEDAILPVLQSIKKQGAASFLESLRSGYNEEEVKEILKGAGLEHWHIYKDDLNLIISSKEL